MSSHGVFNVIGFGITTTALIAMFGKFITKYWFQYMVALLVLLQVAMFASGSKKTQEQESAPVGKTRERSQEDGASTTNPPGASPKKTK